MTDHSDDIHPLRASPDPEDLGLPRLSFERIVEKVEQVPFEAGFSCISALAAEVFHHSEDVSKQVEIAQTLYGEGQLLDKLRAFLARDPAMLVFDERYVTVLQRLLIEHASSAQGEMTGDQFGALLTALLAIPGIVTNRAPGPPVVGAEKQQRDDWGAFVVQGGAYYETPQLADAIARAYATYCVLPSDPRIVQHPDACPLDQWARQDHGLSIANQLAIGFAAAISSGAIEPDKGLAGRRTAIAPGWLSKVTLGSQESDIFGVVSATREDLRRDFAEAGSTPEHISWDRAPFERHPFLKLEDGRMLLISPRMIFSWFTAGIYYRLLDCANARRRTDRPDKTLLTRFTGFVGALSEEYVVRVTRESCNSSRARVYGDLEYRVGKNTKRSPDVAILDGSEMVLVEVFSGRLPRVARVLADEEHVAAALDKTLVAKLNELATATDDVLAGLVPYPDLDIASVKRLWPVLVLPGGGITQLPVLWQLVEDRIREGSWADARIGPRTIATLDDYEALLAICEKAKKPLSELLTELHASTSAEYPPRNWVRVTYPQSGATRPAWVQSNFEAAVASMESQLGLASAGDAAQGWS